MKKLLFLIIFVGSNISAMASEPGDQGTPALMSLIYTLFNQAGACSSLEQSSVKHLAEQPKDERSCAVSVKRCSYGTLPPSLMIMRKTSQEEVSIQTALNKKREPQLPPETNVQDDIILFFGSKENITQ